MLRNGCAKGLLACGVVLGCVVGRAWAQATQAAEPRYKLAYATYLGGGADEQLREVIVYADGSVLVGGQTSSDDLPVTPGVVQSKYAGEPAGTGHSGVYGGDCFLARLSADGSKILLATYFGGSKQERNVYGMALDSKGNIVITSATRSPDFPTTEGAFQRTYGGGPADWMVAKLSGDCKRLLWCTYVGGSGDDFPRGGLTIDPQDNVYVVGTTASDDFPTTEGVVQSLRKGPSDAAVVKLRADGSAVEMGTLLGGGGSECLMGVRVDPAGNIHVAGHTESADLPGTPGAPQGRYGGTSDCFLAGLTPDGRRLLYGTYLGGAANEFAEHQLWADRDGGVLLTGVTASANFPTTGGAFGRKRTGQTDGFLTKLSRDGTAFVFSTLLGGSGGEFFLMPRVDGRGNIFVVGHTDSRDFPVTADALQSRSGGGDGDGVLAVFHADGSKLLYATYLGGGGDDLVRSLALGPGGEVYLVGSTSSPDFPVTPGAVQPKLHGASDGFVVKLVPAR